jgi:hypothetical protein
MDLTYCDIIVALLPLVFRTIRTMVKTKVAKLGRAGLYQRTACHSRWKKQDFLMTLIECEFPITRLIWGWMVIIIKIPQNLFPNGSSCHVFLSNRMTGMPKSIFERTGSRGQHYLSHNKRFWVRFAKQAKNISRILASIWLEAPSSKFNLFLIPQFTHHQL